MAHHLVSSEHHPSHTHTLRAPHHITSHLRPAHALPSPPSPRPISRSRAQQRRSLPFPSSPPLRHRHPSEFPIDTLTTDVVHVPLNCPIHFLLFPSISAIPPRALLPSARRPPRPRPTTAPQHRYALYTYHTPTPAARRALDLDMSIVCM